MDALLVLNNDNIKNCRVLVQITQKQLRRRIIALLDENKGDEAFDVLVKEAEVMAYLPAETPPPRMPLLITLDEQLLKSKSPRILSTVYIIKG